MRAIAEGPAEARGPAVLLTHGAGGDMEGRGLSAGGLAGEGHLAVRFNLPHRESGRASPLPAERAAASYRAVFEEVRRRLAPRRAWAAGGKSYGGRVASLAVAEGMQAAALIFYGYPLHPPGRPDRLRVDHWPSVRVPCLFLQGTRDPFCSLELLEAHLGALGGPATVHRVESGDHSLRVPGQGEAVVMSELAATVSAWLREAVP